MQDLDKQIETLEPAARGAEKVDQRPLRIALVAPLWFPVVADRGGVEQIVFLLARELRARGHDVTLIASGDSARVGQLKAICPEAIVTAMEKGKVGEYSYYEAAEIVETLRLGNSVDIVHSHLSFALVPFSSLFAVPVLHTVHIPITEDTVWLARRFRQAHLVTVSHHQEDALAEAGSGTTVMNGIEMAAFPFCADPDEYLLFLGRLLPDKGPHIAIEVARALGRPLILAGHVVDRPFFEEQIAPWIDGRLVQYVGSVRGVPKMELLRKAKGLLFPLLSEESFGLVMVEAMACGTPVVALKKGAVPEIIQPGVNGFYGEQRADLPALVERLAKLDRAQVRHSAQERFSHHRMVDDYLTLYHRVLRRETHRKIPEFRA